MIPEPSIPKLRFLKADRPSTLKPLRVYGFRVKGLGAELKQVPEPLRVPWVPLAQLAEGPPGLAQFRRLALNGLRVPGLGFRIWGLGFRV